VQAATKVFVVTSGEHVAEALVDFALLGGSSMPLFDVVPTLGFVWAW